MSIKSILAANAKKKRKTAARRRKQNGIAAVDHKYTGDEPVWDGWEDWGVDKFMRERNRAFNFYNYYSNSKELKPSILAWMEMNGYTKEQIRTVRRAPDYRPGSTTGTICTCLARGMPALHPDAQKYIDKMEGLSGTIRSDEEYVREKIAETIASYPLKKETSKDTKSDSTTPAAISPMERLRNKVNSTIIDELDTMLDSWIKNPKAKIEALEIVKLMNKYSLPMAAASAVDAWLLANHSEMEHALNKDDPDLVEHYDYLTKGQLKKRVEALAKMLAEIQQFRHMKRADKKPRVKKPLVATKQVTKLQFKPKDDDFKIASINPTRIIGARRLLAFNTKYRLLLDYVTDHTEGFGVKGTTLQNVTEARSIKLRKPEDILPIVLGKSEKQIDKAWGELTTKESEPKNRINKEVVILRVFE